MSDLFLHSNFVYTSPVPFATTLYNAFRYERIFFYVDARLFYYSQHVLFIKDIQWLTSDETL